VDAVALADGLDGVAVELAVHHHEVQCREDASRRVQQRIDELVAGVAPSDRHGVEDERDVESDDLCDGPPVVGFAALVAEPPLFDAPAGLVTFDVARPRRAFRDIYGDRHVP